MIDERRKTVFLHLGQLSSEYNSLEMWLVFLIWMLIGPNPQIGSLITTRMSMSHLRSLAKRLFKNQIKDEQDVAEFEEILKEVGQAAERRNKYIHSGWGLRTGAPLDSVTRIRLASNRSGSFSSRMEDMKQEAIAEEHEFVRSVRVKLFGFIIHLVAKGNFPEYRGGFIDMDGEPAYRGD